MRRAIEAAQKGVKFDETFNDELYSESNEYSKCYGLSARMMEHLLKLKYTETGYSTYEYDEKHWCDEIRNYRNQMVQYTRWLGKKRTTDINKINKDISEIWALAIYYYNGDIEKNKLLKKNQKHIPEECPWTLEDLLDKKSNELLLMLPDPEEEE